MVGIFSDCKCLTNEYDVICCLLSFCIHVKLKLTICLCKLHILKSISFFATPVNAYDVSESELEFSKSSGHGGNLF